ncbi:MAG: transketolase, partial [Thermodesulfovibrionales bacterium]
MSYQELLYEIIRNDQRYVVLTSENRSSIRDIPKLLKDRFIDTGITEQSLIGISAGLALRKRIPVVHAISAFVTMRAYEFIRTDIAYPNLPVKIAGSFAGLLSEGNGPTHQAVEDVALMRNLPNMVIFCPADEGDLMIGLREVISVNLPCYIRLNHMPACFEHSKDFGIGKAELCYQSEKRCEITILTYGTLFLEAYKACIILEECGIPCRLINMR